MAWNGSGNTNGAQLRPAQPTPTKKAPSALKGIVAGVVVVVVAGGVLLLLTRSDNRPEKATPIEPKRSAIADASTNTAKVVQRTDDKSAERDEPKTVDMWQGLPVKNRQVETNATLITETITTSDGKRHIYYHDRRENVLPTGADQILALITQENAGYGAPPLPSVKNFENDFGDALKREIVINDDDPPDVREVKERVKAARAELLQMMAEGRSANDVLQEWKNAQEDNATVRLDAARKVRELLDQGDREGAERLCEKFNAVLEKSGIMKLELPEESKRKAKK